MDDSMLIAFSNLLFSIAMRFFYGCWPWEYRKTWHSTQHRITVIKPDMFFTPNEYTPVYAPDPKGFADVEKAIDELRKASGDEKAGDEKAGGSETA